MKTTIATAILLLAATPALSEQQAYSCASTNVNGFNFNNQTKQYERSGFVQKRFLMKFDGKTAVVKAAGAAKDEIYNCTAPWNFKPKLFQCAEHMYFMVFDAENLRYTTAQLAGYVDNSPDSILTSYGDCQKC